VLKQNDISKPSDAISLEQRRDFLRLTISERRRILSQQAEDALRHYESEESVSERETWQGGDIVNY